MKRLTVTVLLATAVLLTACSSSPADSTGESAASGGETGPSASAGAGDSTSPGSPASSGPSGLPGPSGSPAGRAALAAPARAYVDAVNAGDLDALVESFAPDGRVMDVSRPIDGRDAIRTWAGNEVIGGRLEVIEVTPREGGQDLLVHWAPAGSDGWRANYRFTMSEAGITLADLQYA